MDDSTAQIVSAAGGPLGAVGVMAWMVRWLMLRMEDAAKGQRETLERLSGVIDRNTTALAEVRATLARCPGHPGNEVSSPEIKVPH